MTNSTTTWQQPVSAGLLPLFVALVDTTVLIDLTFGHSNDWAFNRMEMEKKGVKYDYVTLQPKALGLTLVWSAIVAALGGNLAWSLSTGNDFWTFVYVLAGKS